MNRTRRRTLIASALSSAAVLGLVLAVGASPADAAKGRKGPPGGGSGPVGPARDEPEEQIDVGTRDVLERLKLLRVQMALDREEIEALKLRIEKIQLQKEFEQLLGSLSGPSEEKSSVRRASTSSQILVKAISLQPRKEAIIMYRGRIYNVRPGDSVGNVKIKDITESGLKIGRGGRGGTVR